MRPQTLIISGPHGRIFLCSCIRCTCDNKRTLIGKFLQSLKGRTAHIMSIYIVHFRMICRTLLIMKYNILRQLATETCRLIHIIPYTVHTDVDQKLMVFSPPVAYFAASKIRIICISRPNLIDIGSSLCIGRKISVFFAFFTHKIVRIDFGSRINDRNRFKALFFYFRNQIPRFSVLCIIPCKHTIPIHIINVKMNGITRNIQITEMFCHITDIFCALIAPAALLVSKRPSLRQRCPPGQICIFFNQIRQFFSTQEVQIQIAIIRAVKIIFRIFFAQIEIAVERIIKKHAIYVILFLAKEHRNRLVQRMIVLIVCLWNIGIPVLILIIFFIQESGLITQTVKIIPLVQIKHHLYRIIMCAQIRRIMPFRLQNLFHLLTDFPANTSALPVCPDKRSPVRSRNHHFQIFSKLHPDLIGCNYQIFSFLLCRQFCRNRLVSINGLRIMFLCSVRHKNIDNIIPYGFHHQFLLFILHTNLISILSEGHNFSCCIHCFPFPLLCFLRCCIRFLIGNIV